MKFLSALPALLLLLVRCNSSAQPTRRPPPSNDDAQQYLQLHNQARSDVGVGPLRWSPALAKSASLMVRLQRDKQNCRFVHHSNSAYGGNQFRSSRSRAPPREAVETWVAAKKFYNYANNSCTVDRGCGTYTQVVWKNSAQVGCAQATCVKEGYSLTVCFYAPPGNIVGEKPY